MVHGVAKTWTRLSDRVTLSWQFGLTGWVISSGFPLVNHFDLPGSHAMSGISQDPAKAGGRWLPPSG